MAAARKPPVPRTMVQAVKQALKTADTKPQDVATIALALMYAAAIDAGSLDHGPKLLAALAALGCTPAGRRVQAAVDGSAVPQPRPPTAGGDPPSVNPLALLRDDRALREGNGA